MHRTLSAESDPFDRITVGLYLSMEIFTLHRETRYNQMWINRIHDPSDPDGAVTMSFIKEAMHHNTRTSAEGIGNAMLRPVLCSGLVMGDAHAFETWIDAILTLIFRSFFESCGGIDQGFHNLLFHRYPMLMHPVPVTMVPAEGGWVSSQYECKEGMPEIPVGRPFSHQIVDEL